MEISRAGSNFLRASPASYRKCLTFQHAHRYFSTEVWYKRWWGSVNRLFISSPKPENDTTTIEPMTVLKEISTEFSEEEKKEQMELEMRIRDRSGLKTYWRDKHNETLSDAWKFHNLFQYRKNYTKKHYGVYGKASGLRPGVCWPAKEELEFMKSWEEKFYPPIHQLLTDLENEKRDERTAIEARELEIEENLKKLPKMKEQFFKRLNQKHIDSEEIKAKKEKVIQQVREYLGYDVDPGDSRFQEALQKKEEADKKAKKALKKQDKEARIMAQIAEMAAGDSADVKKKEAAQKASNDTVQDGGSEGKKESG